MFDLSIKINVEGIMPALDTILAKISEIQSGVEAEKAEVKAALETINQSVADLQAKLALAVENQVDVSIVNSALDTVKTAVDSIYAPEAPAPEAPVAE